MSEHTKGRLRVFQSPDGFRSYNDSLRIETEEAHRHPQSAEIGVKMESRYPIAYCAEPISGQGAANARRLVACWNACEGISTDGLESIGQDAHQQYRWLAAQRDELIAALREFRDRAQCGCTVLERHSGHRLGCDMASLMERADELLAKHAPTDGWRLTADDSGGSR